MDLSLGADNAVGVVVDLLLLAVGLALIVKGGDMFVDGSVWAARAFNVPETVIGATVVSVGTTLPEIITSLTSAIKGTAAGDSARAEGYNEIAVGNAVGSMLCNVGLIAALVLIIKPPKTERGFAGKGIFLLFASAFLAVFAFMGGGIDVWEGAALLALFVIFTGLNLYEAGRGRNMLSAVADRVVVTKKSVAKNLALFAFGAAATALGAILLVDNAQSLCVGMGVPQQIVGITVVAIGTSLPELVTSLTSLKKGRTGIGLGNVIGANVINATLLLGLVACATGRGLPIDGFTARFAVPAMLAVSALLVLPSAIAKKTYRWQGAAIIAVYLAFIVYNIISVVV